MRNKDLIKEAMKARENAYAPYSGFKVGAALLAKSGKVYHGCNVENAAFSPGCCAERTAFVKAVSEGEKGFEKIAIVGGKDGEKAIEPCAPCGVCRQVMMEFCEPEDFLIVLANGEDDQIQFTLGELLPLGFGKGNLE